MKERPTFLEAPSAPLEESAAWLAAARLAVKEARKREEQRLERSVGAWVRLVVVWLYTSRYFQMTIAVLIITNFGVSILESETRVARADEEDPRSTERVFEGIEIAFTSVFAGEILLNVIAKVSKPSTRNPISEALKSQPSS